MADIQNPIFVGQLRGRAIRFFKAPNDVVALPWHSVVDLISASGIPAPAQAIFVRMVKTGSFQDAVRTVLTDAGDVLIAPHFVAQGTIGAFGETGLMADADAFDTEFCRAGVGAAQALQAGMTPQQRIEHIIAMGRQHLGSDDPVYSAPRDAT